MRSLPLSLTSQVFHPARFPHREPALSFLAFVLTFVMSLGLNVTLTADTLGCLLQLFSVCRDICNSILSSEINNSATFVYIFGLMRHKNRKDSHRKEWLTQTGCLDKMRSFQMLQLHQDTHMNIQPHIRRGQHHTISLLN